ncbi:DUF4145 domain-containing protein [Pectobacterium parmentieri]|uniref:DUF4145 domain-containing protein n=4 Tax=Enterobacterales TaxID=91347 RepID=A0A0H3I3K6_PECPM|nr:DUF4145 domain-containing protein [Pectobacterium parmentieri]AFI89934.1 Hypothetical protein W5S_1843 [Pectobacterium parmentieri]MBI0469337.1 DUF4145 domain-containing protein [Pectobacterium parmentieri]MBI0491961.1 DUF4145 domain-containing protein [Pectobacterium parmentieri]MBI0557431.1 DUF4145 domain-containing protein [Pectobacterium parmentieri]MBI0566358.1 DUF4145 domain-containing protein [Pectobacterium parmentieri]
MPEQIKKIYCNNCSCETRHSILFYKKKMNVEEEGDQIVWFEEDNYYFSECMGCENITLHIESTYSGLDNEYYTTQFPPKIIRKEPKWLYRIDGDGMVLGTSDKIEIFREIYISLKNNTPRLAVMGVRALLEMVMIENIEDQGSFVKNLSKLKESGYISNYQFEAINKVIEAGHASMHRSYKASSDEVSSIMDITENIIESIYINKLNITKINPSPRVKK